MRLFIDSKAFEYDKEEISYSEIIELSGKDNGLSYIVEHITTDASDIVNVSDKIKLNGYDIFILRVDTNSLDIQRINDVISNTTTIVATAYELAIVTLNTIRESVDDDVSRFIDRVIEYYTKLLNEVKNKVI